MGDVISVSGGGDGAAEESELPEECRGKGLWLVGEEVEVVERRQET